MAGFPGPSVIDARWKIYHSPLQISSARWESAASAAPKHWLMQTLASPTLGLVSWGKRLGQRVVPAVVYFSMRSAIAFKPLLDLPVDLLLQTLGSPTLGLASWAVLLKHSMVRWLMQTLASPTPGLDS